jgi:hypothetical protein
VDVAAEIKKARPNSLTLGDWLETIESGTCVQPDEIGTAGVPILQVNNLSAYQIGKPD